MTEMDGRQLPQGLSLHLGVHMVHLALSLITLLPESMSNHSQDSLMLAVYMQIDTFNYKQTYYLPQVLLCRNRVKDTPTLAPVLLQAPHQALLQARHEEMVLWAPGLSPLFSCPLSIRISEFGGNKMDFSSHCLDLIFLSFPYSCNLCSYLLTKHNVMSQCFLFLTLKAGPSIILYFFLGKLNKLLFCLTVTWINFSPKDSGFGQEKKISNSFIKTPKRLFLKAFH